MLSSTFPSTCISITFLPLPTSPPVPLLLPSNTLCARRRSPFCQHMRNTPADHVRKFLLGKVCAQQSVRSVNDAQQIAITRGIVIFADYLSDLVVLNILNDIRIDEMPANGVVCAVVGMVCGFLAADLVSGLGAWMNERYMPAGAFRFVEQMKEERIQNVQKVVVRKRRRSPVVLMERGKNERRQKTTSMFFSDVDLDRNDTFEMVSSTTETVSRYQLEKFNNIYCYGGNKRKRKDIFERLVNSCGLCIPPLTLIASWSQSVQGCDSILMESFLVTMFSLIALTPLIRANGETDCTLVRLLRNSGILKRNDAPGWCQINGCCDNLLHASQFLLVIEAALRIVNILPKSQPPST